MYNLMKSMNMVLLIGIQDVMNCVIKVLNDEVATL